MRHCTQIGRLCPHQGNGAPQARILIGARQPDTSDAMTPVFDIDDHARLPWRFFGATRAVLARL